MNLIDWTTLPPGIPITLEAKHKGKNCIILAVSSCSSLPWFACFPSIARAIDILSYDGNFASFFDVPQAITTTDELALFKGFAVCMQSLRARNLALAEVKLGAFCQSDEGSQICTLSPYCRVIEDFDGSKLQDNMQEIAKMRIFKNARIRHALENTKKVENLLNHPATWGSSQNTSFLLHFFAFAKDTRLSLNCLIKTKHRGRRNWAIHPEIVADIQKNNHFTTYKRDFYKDAARFVRNKLVHFPPRNSSFANHFHSPDGLITYFNENVIVGGDLIFPLWKAVNLKIKSLSSFWVE